MAKFNVYLKGGFYPMEVEAQTETEAAKMVRKQGYKVKEVTVCTDNTELFDQMKTQGLSPLD